ncbi:MAG: YqgE/AlgH family protein [Nitrospinota bacterium]|nr:MAG: YqgE/AlgH family protein [Nitrospinota bacterium]
MLMSAHSDQITHRVDGLQEWKGRKVFRRAGVVVILITWMLPALLLSTTAAFTNSRQWFSPPSPLPLNPFRGEASLDKGKFLVASRQLGDPRFRETVVFLLRYDPQGAMGVVINRPGRVKLSTLFPSITDLQQRADTLYWGGPVSPSRLMMLFRFATPLEKAQHVWRDLYVSTSRTVLRRILKESKEKAQFRVYAGYAGWAPGQLDHEVWRGDWYVVDADMATIFETPPSQIWPELIRRSTLRKAGLPESTGGVYGRSLRAAPLSSSPRYAWRTSGFTRISSMVPVAMARP